MLSNSNHIKAIKLKKKMVRDQSRGEHDYLQGNKLNQDKLAT